MTAPAIQSTTSSPELNGDVVAEIVLRLPSASVLRCRAVCRAWRTISSSPGFVADHARRRPLELIVQRHGANGVLDTIPLAALDEEGRRCIDLPYPKCETTGRPMGTYSLTGSCDGLLLFAGDSFYGTDHLVCNPVTRQWAAIAPPCRDTQLMTRLCGFYVHGPSGEHRLLFLANDDDDYGDRGTSASHYVRSLEGGKTRRLGPAAATLHMFSQTYHEHLDWHGKLHWLRHPEMDSRTDQILVFDTVSEAFRRMSRPPLMTSQYDEPSLLEMHGMVAVAAILHGSERMDLWVLEDYGNDESWTCRHRIDLPPAFSRARWALSAGVVGRNRDVILLGDSLSGSGSLGLYDLTEKRVLKQVQIVRNPTRDRTFWLCTNLNALVFKDSLQRHAFFDIQKTWTPAPPAEILADHPHVIHKLRFQPYSHPSKCKTSPDYLLC